MERRYSTVLAYAQSKPADLMFAQQLAVLAKERGWQLMSNAAHPGYTRTNLKTAGASLGRDGLSPFTRFLYAFDFLPKQDPDQGAEPLLYGATSPDAVAGGYYGPGRWFGLVGPTVTVRPPRKATDAAANARLWTEAEPLTGSAWPPRFLDTDLVRVIVIGAGVAGASVAYHAGRLGAETVLVDSDEPGQATAAGAGIVCPWTSGVTDPAWHELADAAVGYYSHLLAELGTDIGYRQVGALRLAPDDELVRRVSAAPAAGDVALLSGERARQLFPPLRGDVPALHVPGGARVDGRRLRDALRRATVHQGTLYVSGTASLVAAGERVTGVDVDGHLIEADSVVVAAGAWCRRLLEPIGVHVAVEPQRGQITHLRMSDVDTSAWPVVLPAGSHYLLAFDDGRVVVGATRETGSGFDYRVTAAGQAEVLDEALSVAPGLADAEVLETRIGFRPAGPDALPLLGKVRDGLTVLTGLGPTGLTLGPYVGSLAAKVAVGADVDVSAYDPLR